MGEQGLALVERGQAEGRHAGPEELHGMRIERRGDHRPPLVEGARDGAARHRLVAEVKTVEIAERDDAPLETVGDSAGEGEPLHCPGLYRRSAEAATWDWKSRISRVMALLARITGTTCSGIPVRHCEHSRRLGRGRLDSL